MPAKIDLTNQRFGKLTVIKEAPKKNGRVAWECLCECSNTIIVTGGDLRSGHTSSCGCNKQKNVRYKIGDRIGRLTILADSQKRNNSGGIIWHCQCDCGNFVDRSTGMLTQAIRRNNEASCGCAQKEKLHLESIKYNFNDLTNQRFGLLTAKEYIPAGSTKGQSRSKWKCICDCGNIIEVDTTNLTTGNTTSCGCAVISKGERKISQILDANKIFYITEKSFDNCRFPDSNKLARFDFYLPEYNCLIEYDGKQHFKIGTGTYDNEQKFQLTQQHDKYKNNYAITNNFILIRIPYTHYNHIILDDLLPTTSTFKI